MASGSGGCQRVKRPRTGPGAPAPDWANLTSGPAGLIAERALAHDVADYVRFRAACAAWRACCPDPHAHGVADRRFHPRWWAMLPPPSICCVHNRRRRFLNVATGERVDARVPDQRSYHLLGRTPGGLLVLYRQRTHAVELLNPLTGQRAGYPKASTLVDHDDVAQCRGGKLGRYLSSAPDAGLADDSTLAFILSNDRTLAVAKPGDERWTRLSLGGDRIVASLPFAGRLYCVTGKKVLLVETTATATATAEQQRPRLVVVADHGQDAIYNEMYPVYGDDGGLILVHQRHYPSDFIVPYRAQLDAGSLVPMSGLGGGALFVGPCRSSVSVSVSASSSRVFASVRADTVYVCHRDFQSLKLKAVAVDLLDLQGGCYEVNFGKRGIVHHLASHVCPL